MGCRFKIVGWSSPESDDWTPPKKKMPASIRAMLMGLDTEDRTLAPHSHAPRERPAFAMARRIEALARVIANPAPAIARLARFIARLPRGALEIAEAWRTPSRLWLHGRQEFLDATDHSRSAEAVYHRVLEAG